LGDISVYKIAISGLVALAAVLGGSAVPATAMTQPSATARIANAATSVDGAALVSNSFPKISCVTGMDCLGIIGSSSLTDGTTTPTSIARWNGTVWKRAHWTLPKGTRSLDLNGVSCKAAKSCLVVGDYYTGTSDSASSHVLALIYNGTSLKPMPTVPLPKSTMVSTLLGVSCTTAKHCVAIGSASGDTAAFGADGTVSLIETWNGANWTLHTAGTAANVFAEFSGISCATSAYCVLAGESVSESGRDTLYLRSWNGKKLTVLKPVAVGSSTNLPLVSDVSCATPSNCAVTGAILALGSTAETFTTFTEIWNGKTWRTAKVTWPTATTDSFLIGVSCFGAHSCDAVGLTSTGTATDAVGDPAAASYNGTSWALQTVPVPAKGRTTILTDVKCLSAVKCVAVGETGLTTAASPATMTGVWNGKAWRFHPGF
jgi:hypothetical protein